MTRHTSYHPLPVRHIKQDKNREAFERICSPQCYFLILTFYQDLFSIKQHVLKIYMYLQKSCNSVQLTSCKAPFSLKALYKYIRDKITKGILKTIFGHFNHINSENQTPPS